MGKQVNLRSPSGFSLVELMVALTVGGIVLGAAIVVTFSSREIFETDQARTTINQNLRSGMNLVGIDIRQAGERLPRDIPAVEIVNDPGGNGDELVVRRHLLDAVMPVCKPINGGSSADSVFIAKKKATGKVSQGCNAVPDADGDGWPDNLGAWRAYRIATGGVVCAYIYNPTSQVGEFFEYDAEDNAQFHIHRGNSEPWTHDYGVADNARVYLLEQLTFRLDRGLLQSVSACGNTLNLVNGIADLQIRAFMRDGTVQDALGSADEWSDLQSIEVTLVGESRASKRTIQRSLVTHFFPRNVLSLN